MSMINLLIIENPQSQRFAALKLETTQIECQSMAQQLEDWISDTMESSKKDSPVSFILLFLKVAFIQRYERCVSFNRKSSKNFQRRQLSTVIFSESFWN